MSIRHDRAAEVQRDRGDSASPADPVLIPPEAEALLDPFGDHDGPCLADLEWDMLQARPTVTADPPSLPLLPFADWIEVRASLIRLDDTDAARWLAAKLDELAAMARRLQAETPNHPWRIGNPPLDDR